jgi:hypothetical protein
MYEFVRGETNVCIASDFDSRLISSEVRFLVRHLTPTSAINLDQECEGAVRVFRRIRGSERPKEEAPAADVSRKQIVEQVGKLNFLRQRRTRKEGCSDRRPLVQHCQSIGRGRWREVGFGNNAHIESQAVVAMGHAKLQAVAGRDLCRSVYWRALEI